MSLPRYTKYKDSSVEWLGEVPEHWDVTPLKRHVRLLTEKTDRRQNPVGLENIESWTGRYLETESDFEGEGIAFEPGDVLFGKLRPYLAKALVAVMSGEAVGDFFVMRPHVTLDANFLRYQLLSRDFINVVDGSTFGSKMPRASWEVVGSLRSPVPSRDEQRSIVRFLDSQTTKLDQLIVEQRKLIELLKQKRQAVISRAVGRGLNPDVPLKPSDIEGLPEIPTHWTVRSLASITSKITNGYVGPTRDILVDEGVRYLQSLHIKGNRIRFEVPYYVTSEWSERHAKSILEEGDVLIVQTGDIGQVAVVPSEFAGCNCHALIVVAPIRTEVNGSWLSWYLNSATGLHGLLSLQTGALHPHLNCGKVKGLSVPLPPLAEQKRIAEHVERRMAEFDQMELETERATALLQERRAALISAAITGKIDVRGCSEAAA